MIDLTTPLDVRVVRHQNAPLPGEEATTLARLFSVREIEEDDSGARLHFQQGGHGRLSREGPNYLPHLRLVKGSQERQCPVGLSFGEQHAITKVLRADNDLPAELWDEGRDCTRVLFQGHDGVFCLKADHPELARIRVLLGEAIRQKARVWFIAQKPDLALLDVMAAGWAVAASPSGESLPTEFRVSFVVAPDHLLKSADEILRSNIRCTKALRRDIRAVAKAFIDEADELKRAVREFQTNASRIQIESLSPQDLIEKAKNLRTAQLTNKSLQAKVQAVANSYVLITEKNQRLFEEFKEIIRGKLTPAK